MKKVLAWVLLLVLVLGMFAGCKRNQEEPETTPSTEPSVVTPEGPTAEDAMDYLKAMYPDTDEPTKTPVNYERYGIVRIAGVPFTVVWTVDVAEDLVKVIVNEDGNVTIDVNEACEVATPYTLTATITDEFGGTATHSWAMMLPSIGDMIEIVKEAYALAPGESLPYEVTLRGKIVSIDSVYNPEYQNITVTIVVEGAEDMPIQCYRMKGEGCEGLLVGNIITVTGTIKNYNGTIEFDSGCMLVAVEQGEAIAPPTDVGEILKAAYALPSGQALPYPVTLTGKVTKIDSPYDANYGNISVEMVMDGYPNYPVLCYRLKGTDADLIARDDIITVTGIIKNYKGTIEFDTGCILVERISGGRTAKPESFDKDAIMADAKKLYSGEKLDYYANLTGKVIEIDSPYDKNYGNISVIMQVKGYENNPIICYRMKSGNADVSKVCVGDTISVRGVIENYKGSLEFGTGCTLQDRISGGGVAKPESSDQKQILADAAKLGSGQKLSYFANLTGKVVEIDSPYDKNYGNMSVYINVGGTKMLCYRLKSGAYDVSKVCVGDTISVRGVIENYKGDLQFGTGSTLENRISGGGVAKPESTNQKQILADAAKLNEGQKLSYYATLTGKVTEIDSPYDKNYGNMSVYINVNGTEMLCYRLKSGAYDVSKVCVGDTITVRGVIENYKGALQFGTGATLEKRVSGGGVAQAESTDAKKILADAAKLKDGEKLGYYATLTGKVTKLDTPYDSEYGNISVYIDVDGNSLLCYRLKSGAADASKIAVGDTITVRGVIENYKGAPQFGTGSTLVKRVSGGGVAKPESSDQAKIMADAAKLADGEKLEYFSNLTGKVTSIDSWYDPEYGNVCVYMELSDGTKMLCYRMKSGKADASQVRPGDTITVHGVIENFKGEIQMGTGCTLQKLVKGVNPGDNMTTAEILEAAMALSSGQSLEGAYTLTGVISSVDKAYESQYKNITVSMQVVGYENFTIQCYRLAKGAVDVANLKVGDTITVYGSIINYNGKVQFDQGCVLIKRVAGEGNDFVLPEDGISISFASAANRVSFSATEQVWKENGITVTNAGQCGDYLNPVRFYKNTTVSIAYPKMTRIIFNVAFADRIDPLTKSLVGLEGVVVNVYDMYVVADFHNAVDTFEFTMADQTRLREIIVCQGTTPPDSSNVGGSGNTGSGAYGTFTTAPQVGVAYKLGLDQTNKGATYYFIGAMSASSIYYGGTETNYAQGVDVYLENADGGYYLYFMEGTTKRYVAILANGTHMNFTFDTGAKSVFTFDTANASLYTTVNGTVYYMGTYDNFVTIGTTAQDMVSSSYVTHLYTSATGGNPSAPSGGNTGGSGGSTTTPPEIPEGSVNISFDDTANRTQFSKDIQVWEQNGITVTNNKAASGSDVADYAKPARFYQDSELIIEYPGMTRLVFNVAYSDRVEGLVNSLKAVDGVIVVVDDLMVYADLPAAADKLVLPKLVKQTRLYDITVCTGTTPPEGGNQGGNEGGGSSDVKPADGYTFVDAPVVGTAYKFGMFITPLGNDNYYINGAVEGNYAGTTTKAAEGKDVYLEEVSGGYSIYYLDGSTKVYMNIIARETDASKVRIVFQTAAEGTPSVYTLNTENKYIVTTVNGTEQVPGTYTSSNTGETFKTMSGSKSSFLSNSAVIGVTQFPAWFMAPGEGGGNEGGNQGGNEEENKPVELVGKKVVADFSTLGFELNQGNYTDLAIGENITMDAYKAYVKSHVRLYINAQAAEGESYLIIKSANAANGLIANAFYTIGTNKIRVSGSNDNGATWDVLGTYNVNEANPKDFSFGNGNTYTWFKVEIVKDSAATAQLRFNSLTLVLPEE